MNERSSPAMLAIGTTLAALGGGALITFAVSGQGFPGWVWGLATCGFVLGLGILFVQLPAVEAFVFWPWRRIRRTQLLRRALDARYRQSLRCDTCGHEFEETVVSTARGWLMSEGAERTCPACGSGMGFSSLGAVPLNKAARKLRAL
jgi:hypothetical protein